MLTGLSRSRADAGASCCISWKSPAWTNTEEALLALDQFWLARPSVDAAHALFA